MTRTKVKIDKSDFYRTLLTDTAPFETPIIFSNHGLYNHCINLSAYKGLEKTLIDTIINSGAASRYTKPYHYKIGKGIQSYRILSLLHPRSQKAFAEFYREYDTLICLHCESDISLRTPVRPGAAYYIPNRLADSNKYRSSTVNTVETDTHRRHSHSYFSYSRYRRLHQFFTSTEFFALERRYRTLLSVDVARCFDSIYTHTLSWAVKSREFSKKTTAISSTFGQRFDKLMQNCNYGETNGIPIGPEVSRIFAEIILQDIETSTINALASEEHKLLEGDQFVIRRYVDDIFIFSENPDIAHAVCRELEHQMHDYKLRLNKGKERLLERPFVTTQSKAANVLARELERLLTSTTNRIEHKGRQILVPKSIRRPTSLANDFVSRVKTSSDELGDDFSLACNYVIASLTRSICRLYDDYYEHRDLPVSGDDIERFFRTLLEIMFFMYGLCPTVGTSFDISRAIILCTRLLSAEFPDVAPYLKERVTELSSETLFHQELIGHSKSKGYVPLEKLNILLAISELGPDHLLRAEKINKLFDFESLDPGYFAAMCCLYYIKDHDEYSEIKTAIEKYLDDKLSQPEEIVFSSEAAHIFLDTLSCPFLARQFRCQLALRVAKIYAPSTTPAEAMELVEFMQEREWFTNWGSVDLLAAIEKKRLTETY